MSNSKRTTEELKNAVLLATTPGVIAGFSGLCARGLVGAAVGIPKIAAVGAGTIGLGAGVAVGAVIGIGYLVYLSCQD